MKILEFRLKIGNKWSEMVKALPGRTENRIKNRFNCMFKKAREIVVFQNKSYNMEEALSQIDGNQEHLCNEEEIVKFLITAKKEAIDN